MQYLPTVSIITVEAESLTLLCLLALGSWSGALLELSCSLAVCFHRPPAFLKQRRPRSPLLAHDGLRHRKRLLPLRRRRKFYNSEIPLGILTTMVPAIMSCQESFSRFQPAQKNPRNITSAEKKLASDRTSATAKSSCRPSRRKIFIPKTIPPIVVPFHVHMPTWYATHANGKNGGK